MHMQGVAHAAMAPEDRQPPDGDFKPNLINTVCFLANFAIQTMTFAVNYVGEPFATPLVQNTMFAQSIRWSVMIFIVLALDAIWGLNDWFSLIAMPTSMKMQMVGLGCGAYLACRGIERFARTAFPAALPPEKGAWLKGRSNNAAASHSM
jgi:cation-transporting ATPase 13A1